MNKKLVFSAAVLFLAAGCVSRKQYLIKEDLAYRLGEENADLKNQLSTVTADRDALRQTNDGLLRDMTANKTELSKRVADLTAQNQDMARQLRDLEAAKAEEVSRLKSTYEQLVGDLKSEIASGEVQITNLKGKLSVNLVDRILFDSGKSEVKASGQKVLDRVGTILKNAKDRQIVVEGHTDNVPIGGVLKDKYLSNWELSSARALNVVHYLQDHVGVEGDRLAAIGYGEHKPVAPNDTPENKAKNRRIELVLGNLPAADDSPAQKNAPK